MTEVLVRPARPADAAAMARVHVDGWRQGYAGLLPAEHLAGLSVERSAASMRRRIAGPSIVLVAELDGSVAGFVQAHPDRADPSLGEVSALYADPARWSRGIGSALLTAATDRLAADGFGRVRIWVLEGNDRALAFYARHGWLPDGGTRPDEVGGAVVRDLSCVRDLPPH